MFSFETRWLELRAKRLRTIVQIFSSRSLSPLHPAVGNGGRTDKYVWIQQLSDLTVNIPVPAGTKTKMLDIKITNTKLSVSVQICLFFCFCVAWLV